MALGRNHKIFNIGNSSGTIQGLTRVYHDLTLSGDGTLSSLLGVVGSQDDEEVNQYVYDNSATIDEVNTSYQTNSGNFLTAIPDYYATTGDINDLAQSISENYQVKGDYVERNSMASAIESATSGKLDASSFASVSGDFLVASSLNGYATESFVEETSGAITSLIPTNYYPDTNPSAFVNEDWVTAQGYITGVNISESATWNETSTTVQTNSSNWDNVSNKLDTSAFSNVSGTFLTAHQDLSNYYTKDETSGKEELANAFANIPVGDAEVNNYVHDTSATIDEVNSTVQSNSGNWNEISSYQNVSSTYLTAIPNTLSISVLSANDRVNVGNDKTYSNFARLDRNGLFFKKGTDRPYNIGIDSTGSNFYIATAKNGYARIYASSISGWNDALSSYQNASSTYLTAVNIPESADWEDTTDVVQTNSASWGAGSTPTYDYTDNNLISAIDTSGLYATSAYVAKYANTLINGGRLGTDVYAITGAGTDSMTLMILNPNTTPFGNTSGIYYPLYYANGACMTYGSSAGNTQYFGGFVKGNEWYVSNATAGQALRGETHNSRGVHISGVTTAGTSFDLSVNCVSGKNSTADYNWKLERGCVSGKSFGGEWRYGPAEDTALRTVSALPQINFVSTSSEATGTNILYVVTGAGA